MHELYRIINFKRNCGSCGGSLVQFQQGDTQVNALPFEIGKVLVMSDIRTDDVRGNHAHHETEEILVALTGGCVVDLDDGRGRRESVRLSASETRDQGSEINEPASQSAIGNHKSEICRPTSDFRPLTSGCIDPNNQSPITNNPEIKALLLFPHVWRTMRDFEPGTMLMVVADIKYDEADYIRNRAEFERISKDWKMLGGSSSQGKITTSEA